MLQRASYNRCWRNNKCKNQRRVNKRQHSDYPKFNQLKDKNQKVSKDSINIKEAIKDGTEKKNSEEFNPEKQENKDLNPNESIKIDLDKIKNEI